MNQPIKIKPIDIVVNKLEGMLIIKWNDGAYCRYPLSNLREACPCAECRGGHQNMGPAGDPENILVLKPSRSYRIEDMQPVGNYAIQPFWDDNHHTGIYTWDYLRKLCVPEPAPPANPTETPAAKPAEGN